MSSTSRLRVDFSIRRIRETSAGRTSPSVGDGREDVRLADPQPERPEGLVVQGRDHPIDQPDPHGDALVRHPIRDFCVSTFLAPYLSCIYN